MLNAIILKGRAVEAVLSVPGNVLQVLVKYLKEIICIALLFTASEEIILRIFGRGNTLL